MEIERLATWSFRNLEPGPVEVSPGVNLFFGANGQGKSNVLEALAVAGTLRSFRSARLKPLVTTGGHAFRVATSVRSANGTTALEVQWDDRSTPRRNLFLDGWAVPVDRYLTALPVVVIASGDRELVVGKPALRRAFLDRLTFLLRSVHLSDLRLYTRLLQQRNAGLARGLGRREMEAWEERLADVAARVVVARRHRLAGLVERFTKIYEVLGDHDFPHVALSYGAESFLGDDEDAGTLAEIYRKRYNDQRDRDRETGYTTVGPHRHDVVIRSAGGPAREYLSAGQIKTIAVALRLSFLEEVEQDRGEQVPLGIDDIDVEIDEAVTERFLSLAGSGRQLLITSTRSELPGLGDVTCHRFVVNAGSIRDWNGEEERQ